MINVKTWKLWLAPFIFIAIVLVGESLDFQIQSNRTFESIAKETAALSEVDIREFEQVKVVEVVDGDTIIIEGDHRVRFIGVDTPETVHPNKPVQCFGREASGTTKALLEGKTILMEKDISDTDRYGRLLRYIYLPNPERPEEVIFVNEYLIEQGYGQVITYPPDVKYKDLFLDAQRDAQKEKRGLWGKC